MIHTRMCVVHFVELKYDNNVALLCCAGLALP
jgi:hypothetical protein